MLLVTLLVAVIFTVEKCSETLCKFRRCLFLLVVNAGGREWLFNRLGREGREGRDAREGREKGRKGGTGGRDGKDRREGRTGRKRGKYLTGKYFCISSFYFFKIHIMLYFGIEGLRFKCSNWNQDQQSFKWNQNIFSQKIIILGFNDVFRWAQLTWDCSGPRICQGIGRPGAERYVAHDPATDPATDPAKEFLYHPLRSVKSIICRFYWEEWASRCAMGAIFMKMAVFLK